MMRPAKAAKAFALTFGVTTIWASEPFVHLPTTISDEAAAVIRMMPDPSLQPASPDPEDVDAWVVAQEAAAARNLERQKPLIERLAPDIEEDTIGDVPVLDIKPAGWTDNGKVLVYTHGGAYTFQSAESTLVSSTLMADASGLRVISVDYTLAPQAQWEEITDQVVAVFKALNSQGYEMADIAIYGDSAGGSLAAGVVLKMRDMGMGMPAAIVLWSPWSDIADVGDTYETLKHAEPFYTYRDHLSRSALAYADPEDHSHSYVSPVYGDYSKGYPPTLIQGGTKEIFLSNFVRHYQALDMAGQDVTLDLYDGMVHVFQAFLAGTPESDLAVSKSAEFLNEHLLDGDQE